MRLHCCSCVYRKACGQGIQGCIGQDMGRVKVEFVAPDESCLLTLLDNGLEKASEDGQPIAGPDAGETRNGLGAARPNCSPDTTGR